MLFCRKKKEDALTAENRELLEQLFAAKTALDGARRKFEYVTEPDMVTSCIYEIHAAKARYDHLLGRVRAQGISMAAGLRG